MKKSIILPLLLLLFSGALLAQDLPVRSVTIFKNNRSLVQRSGKVKLTDARFTTRQLPEALFGTFWAGSPDASLQSVFSAIDSVDSPTDYAGIPEILKKNLGKPVKLYLSTTNNTGFEIFEGTCEKVLNNPRNTFTFVFRTNNGRWLNVYESEVRRIEFASAPDLDVKMKKTQKRLEFSFQPNTREANLDLVYLTDGLGWAPIYRLELNDKNSGRLSLRAEVANNAENLGDTELRLAVGVPNFAFANRPELLVHFEQDVMEQLWRDNNNPYRGNAMMLQSQSFSNSAQSFDMEMNLDYSPNDGGGGVNGAQAEDFYFYTIRPGNFPKDSRYQFPIFESDIEPSHYYECVLKPAQSGSYSSYKNSSREENRDPVIHYIEFKNTTAFPWTTGAVNLLSRNDKGLQPISQDVLPYTAPGATCKIKIAETPEIRISQAEGDVDRQENARKFFSTTYDKVKIEAQVSVVNYRDEPVKLKVKRTIEGKPLQSEQKWNTRQEQATLRVNPAYSLEWVIELKPGEERKWTYSYEVFVNM
ncbi:MAG: DUF4139 domain-containing protein [Saprospiraceae bacterium]|nr:DUF4139 domain-containing protein [Saprospiraceae bacterium]